MRLGSLQLVCDGGMQQSMRCVCRAQAELQSLKEQHGGRMHLRKATDTATAPFPIAVTVTVPQPPAAASYDCDSLQVGILLACMRQRPCVLQ